MSKSAIKWPVYVVAVLASMGGLLFGFDIGGSGGTFVMTGFHKHFEWENASESSIQVQKMFISGLFTFGALWGALLSGSIANWVGFKKGIQTSCIMFVFGTSLQAAAVTIYMMCVGRFFGGMAIGSLSALVPIYQSEMAPECIRGALVSLQQLSITLGIVLIGACNIGLETVDWGWRVSYGGNIVLAIIMLVVFFFMDESPRWLVRRGKITSARNVLKHVRQPEEVELELDAIQANAKKAENEEQGEWKDLFSNNYRMRYRLFLGCAGQFLQQFSGINAIMTFAPDIFETLLKDNRKAIYCNLALQIGNFLSTFICIYLIERVGRVKLLITGGVGMFFSMLCVFILHLIDTTNAQYVIIVFSCLYVVFFAYSWGPLVWVLCSEIYPNSLRSKSMSLATATNWGAATIIIGISPWLLGAKIRWAASLFFSFWIGLIVLFSLFLVPETAGFTLEQVDNLFANFRISFFFTRPLYTPEKVPIEQEEAYVLEKKTEDVIDVKL